MPATAATALWSNEAGCRSCHSSRLEIVHEFGPLPLADRLLPTAAEALEETRVPLTLLFCPACGLVQIRETVDPHVLFAGDYPYLSSVSPALTAHFRASAEQLIEQLRLNQDDLVIEAASNDGCMLVNFQERGIPVLGIDPSAEPVLRARARGIPTLRDFFGDDLAQQLRQRHPRGASLFLANNVLAHVADLHGFVAGIRHVLADDGAAVIEVPYVVDLISHGEFDTIYHQHLCYFSVASLGPLFRRHGLSLVRVERIPIHGGSLRLTLQHPHHTIDAGVETLRAWEASLGVQGPAFYQSFSAGIATLRHDLRSLLADLRSSGKRIAGYGAAAKGCTLLNYFGIAEGSLEYIVDRNDYKVGKFMAGVPVPIVDCAHLEANPPDYLLILAWNFAEEIMDQLRGYRAAGGRFILPLPELAIR